MCNQYLQVVRHVAEQNVVCTEGSWPPPTGARAVGLAARLGTSQPPLWGHIRIMKTMIARNVTGLRA